MTNELIVRELERIAADHDGILQPETVVNTARDPKSPLHGWFQWDDSEAAKQWRLQQARQLIRVAVTYEQVAPDKRIAHRVFVSVSTDRQEDGGGYRLTSAVLNNEELRRQMLIDARAEMQTFRNKYATLSELARVFVAMDAVVEDNETVSA